MPLLAGLRSLGHAESWCVGVFLDVVSQRRFLDRRTPTLAVDLHLSVNYPHSEGAHGN